MTDTIVAGGGASGTLLAIALLQQSDCSVVTVEPRDRLGAGVAYSTSCPAHLLNVPAGRMSAFPNRPDDFVRWLVGSGHQQFESDSFVPRRIYGEYLDAKASQMLAQAGSRWRHVRNQIIDAWPLEHGVKVELASGERLTGDVVVVATGNADPAPWPGIGSQSFVNRQFFSSTWHPGALVPHDRQETVLVLGTGLTAIDAVIGLRHNGHRGTIFMISRRGLLPHEHRMFDIPPANADWRIAMDRARPETNALWQRLGLSGQRRFMRHMMPYWNVHRHRMAPEIAKSISELIGVGTLRMLAGRTRAIEAYDGKLRVAMALRSSGREMAVDADRVINCSGPEHDFRKLPNPLIRSLLRRGLMVPHELGVGVTVANDGALVGFEGLPSDRFFAIGATRFGTLIETTAIAEIRVQAVELAHLLLQRESAIASQVMI